MIKPMSKGRLITVKPIANQIVFLSPRSVVIFPLFVTKADRCEALFLPIGLAQEVVQMVVCRQCHRAFRPDPRIGAAQRTCSRKRCQRSRRRKALRLWRVLHPENVRIHAQRDQARAKANPGYWRHYRKAHPEYRAGDNERRRRARRRAARAANETLIARISRRKFRALKAVQGPPGAANETSIHRRVSVVVDYLLWKERAANETDIATAAARRA